ncbi:MAG: hypothetical protein HQL45_00155, partial [Alphaproteobacteria bacterium]|nr:hypothetical protein [Alphaproteobacteria bacterium]
MTPSTLFRPLAHLFFGLPFYGYFLKSTSPAALALGPADPWPGNADLAQRLVTGDVTLANPHDFNELSD